MKRIFAVSLIFFTMSYIPAFCEENSLSETPTCELIEQYDAIYNELLKRVNESAYDSSIARGQYIVGQDISAGRYEFTCTNAIVEGEYEFPYISIYKILNTDEFEKQLDYRWYNGTEERYYSNKIEVGSKVSFTLEDDMILVITRCDGFIQNPDHSWEP